MPAVRLSRLRKDNPTRDWISEVLLRPKDLIQPYFVVGGKRIDRPVRSLPGVSHLSIDKLLKDMDGARKRGIKSVLLFGIPGTKDKIGAEAYKKNGIVQKAVKEIKKNFKDIIVITDVCLCGYTAHGHCGIFKERGTGGGRQGYIIDNDKTLKALTKIALSHAASGADLVAPSAMMDGQVRSIREGLDKNAFENTGILAYSAKYASNFYGPFREASDSGPQFGDRKGYQMDPRNSNQALREIREDIKEGADIVMVKPALSYLDIIYRAKEKFNVPVAAYNVSGEYTMVEGYIDSISHPIPQGYGPRTKSGILVRGGAGSAERMELRKNIVLEILTGIKRAGADFIITYWAKEAAKWLRL
ncbi:MAG TPA: porphobilinogen synthase [Candidatus Omnitrophica bacterium]|nr:porphobilinogen synthase [Candidatus Omnitrophota bacterium]